MTDIPKLGFPKLGYRNTNWSFGFDTNEIRREFYCGDEASEYPMLYQMIYILLGDPYQSILPHAHPTPYSNFRCCQVQVDPINPKSIQGSTYDALSKDSIQTFLDTWETNNGGWKVIATYRPWFKKEGSIEVITDETYDFTAQTMALIGNNVNTDPENGLHWASKDANGKGILVTNLKTITKIIPKIEILQKRVFLKNVPNLTTQSLIGSVNLTGYKLGQQDNNNMVFYPSETLLFLGCPVVRKHRFDDKTMFECSLKFAANLYRDKTDGGYTGQDYVTWNRLFRPETGTWERMLMGALDEPLYPKNDFTMIDADIK